MRRWVIFGILLLAMGCVGTPVPQPPNLDPVDPDRLGMGEEETTGLSLLGLPGAAVPGSEVWGFNLEDDAAASVAEVQVDGGFEIGLGVSVVDPDEIWLQARNGVDRSEPLHILLGTTSLTFPSRPTCVVMPTDVDLGVARDAVIRIENECGFEIQLISRGLRASSPEFVVSGPEMALLPDGASLELDVSASGVASVEDIVFVNIAVEGTVHRFPIGIVARPAP